LSSDTTQETIQAVLGEVEIFEDTWVTPYGSACVPPGRGVRAGITWG